MFNTLERFIKKFRKFSDNDEFSKRALRHIEWILSGEHEINVSKNQVTLNPWFSISLIMFLLYP